MLKEYRFRLVGLTGLVLVFMSALHGAQRGGASGVLEGTVLRLGTTEPIADVSITVLPATNGATGERGAASQPSLAAVSDASGRFIFTNVPVGNITVRGQLPGYFGAPVNGSYSTIATSPATIVGGQTASVRLLMVPGGSMSGRVLDMNGRAMADIAVQALRVTYQDGRVVPQSVASRTTDDRGDFRLFRLPPGDYYLAAAPASTFGVGGRGASAQASREIPVRTLYPSVPDLSTAIPISVRAGEESSGLDIRMRTARGVTVSGRVGNTLPPGPAIRCRTTSFGPAGGVRPFIAELALQSVEGTSSEDGLSTGVINAKEDGSFEIHNVLPGSYELVARLPVNVGWGEQSPPGLSVGSLAFGRTSLQVRDSDISNVSVIVHPGMDLVGFVAVDGKPAQAAVRIALQPDDVATRNPVFGAILGQVGAYQPPILADGRFTIPVVPPGHYRLQVFPGETPQPLTEATPCSGQATRKPQTGLTAVHPQTYLADIRQRGISVYDKGLTFGSDPVGPIEVLLNTNAGSIAGIVVGPDRRPIARATVVLVPPMNRRQNPALYKLARSDAEGRFSLDLVPPGSYKLFAWESVQPSAYQNAGFLEKFEDRGVNVTVSPGSRVDVTVDWIADSVSR